MTPIGRVLAPNDGALERAFIQIDDAFVPGLLGIGAYSHLIVLYEMHGAVYDPKLHLPGVFATRARERPNAIGFCVVELLRVDDELLTVRGLDALDQSPVLDLKPYIGKTDAVPLAVPLAVPPPGGAQRDASVPSDPGVASDPTRRP